jgi:hypothetical protein
MPRKTKYCLNYAIGQHLNDGKSPSHMHCSACYEQVKKRYDAMMNQGGPLVGLRAARMHAGGSFGYERTQNEKETNLMAFFNYVMPHIPIEQARKLSKEIAANSGTCELPKQDGSYRKVKMY